MSGQWAGSTRSQQLPADWPERREATRQRAGGRCEKRTRGQRCPNTGSDCDHIKPGDNHSLTNLQWLCPSCHQAKTQREAQAARAAQRAQRYRPREDHPGRLTPGAR